MVEEKVNHPKHYNMGTIEVIDIIEDWDLNFNVGNVLKYVMRAKNKAGVEDLEKAKWYLEREISRMKQAEKEGIKEALVAMVETACTCSHSKAEHEQGERGCDICSCLEYDSGD